MRIAIYEDKLNAVITVNPQGAGARPTRSTASARRGRSAGRCTASRSRSRTTSTRPTCRRPAARWPSTGFVPPYEATLTKNLRDAGAIIIAKTGMTELANWVGAPTPMPGNYNAAGRLRHQPLRPAPRSARGDVRRPAGAADRRLELGHRHGRELLGRQRRHRDVGLDPEPGEPEHAGRHQADRRPHQPLRRHPDHRRPGHRRADGAAPSRDAAIMLGALESAAPDPHDPATNACTPPPNRDYTVFLKRDGLKGARIGIPRAFFYDRRRCPGADGAARRPQRRPGQGDGRSHRRPEGRRRGSSSIPPTSRASSTTDPKNNFLLGTCSGVTTPRARTPTARSC